MTAGEIVEDEVDLCPEPESDIEIEVGEEKAAEGM